MGKTPILYSEIHIKVVVVVALLILVVLVEVITNLDFIVVYPP